MKILIGVDESSCSNAALQFVQRLSLPAGTGVTIVSAVQVALPVYSEAYVPAAGAVEQFLAERTKALQELASQAERQLRDRGLVTETKVLEGNPREVIVETARDMGADLVVVGSHGRSGIGRLVLGSVASHVVTHAPCSVLVVKAK